MTNDYIHPRFDIVGPEYSNFIFGGAYIFQNIANNCIDMDKTCHTYLSRTGKIFVMNCYGLLILFISYIHFVTQSSSFCVQVKVSGMIDKSNTSRSTFIEIMLIHFWISPKS